MDVSEHGDMFRKWFLMTGWLVAVLCIRQQKGSNSNLSGFAGQYSRAIAEGRKDALARTVPSLSSRSELRRKRDCLLSNYTGSHGETLSQASACVT